MLYPESALIQLECPECEKFYTADEVQTFCPVCHALMLARYDLSFARSTLTRESLSARPKGIWRWSEILPVRTPAFRLTLGEGDTPLLTADNLGKSLGLTNLYIKNESVNPTGSFKARGMVIALARAMELGLRDFVNFTTGDDGGALAAYAARGRAQAHVYMPKDAPLANQVEVSISGAELVLVDGLLSEVAQLAGDDATTHGWFNLSTFKEPYRCEGEKTIGLELAEAFDWDLPDVIICPSGSEMALVGIWKAFEELEQMGFIGAKRPRMVRARFESYSPNLHASVDHLISHTIRESTGAVLEVPDEEIISCQKELATAEGIFAAPEGAATLAAAKHLLAKGWLMVNERVVLLNAGFGLKYL